MTTEEWVAWMGESAGRPLGDRSVQLSAVTDPPKQERPSNEGLGLEDRAHAKYARNLKQY